RSRQAHARLTAEVERPDAMMHIGVLQFSMDIPAAESLKDKRRVVQSLKEKLRRSFNISIAEVDDHDVHTVATLGAVMAGADIPYINGALDKILEQLNDWRDAELSDSQLEII